MTIRPLTPLIALALLVTACGGGGGGGGLGGSPEAAPPGSSIVVEMTDYKITVNVTNWRAGGVTFGVRNLANMEHSFVVIKTLIPQDKLPVDGATAKAKEDVKMGEIKSIAAGKSAALRLELQPGKYVLICNIAGHYQLGMHNSITMDPP
jgi:uncharacterized cupredoxin-like copper-binding protein